MQTKKTMLERETHRTEQPDFGDSTSSFALEDLSCHLNKPRRQQSARPKTKKTQECRKRGVRREAGALHSAHSSPYNATATATTISTNSIAKDHQLAVGAANTHCSPMCRPPPLYGVDGDVINDDELDPPVRPSHTTLSSSISTPTTTITTSPAFDKNTSNDCVMNTIAMWKRQQREEERRLKKEQRLKQKLSSSDSKISYSVGSTAIATTIMTTATTTRHSFKSPSVAATSHSKDVASSTDVDCYFVQAFVRNLSRKQQQQQQQAPQSLMRYSC